MAAISTIIAGTALAVSAVGTASSIKNGRQDASASREAAAFQQKQANLQQARQKRDAVRAARLSFGQAQQAAANQGVSTSSSSLGGLSSIASQASDNISFLDQYGFYSDQASKALGRANSASARAAEGANIAQLGFSVFNNADSIAKIFR